MLLCASCDEWGAHMSCINLQAAPEGEWNCRARPCRWAAGRDAALCTRYGHLQDLCRELLEKHVLV